ncbi:hypothetical protein [Nocardia transvalensis]|uniref:hypothetical protein n=1 Tax=Nocardia transvalensis TaxID=37333 RepID=UPI001893F8D1|nr:hypothetical protein [Nocardia transvalensis]MBF6330839.1 hypothetical protein [Nocardia transvalensis]
MRYEHIADVPDGMTVFSGPAPMHIYRRWPKAVAGKEYEFERLDRAKGPVQLVTEHQVQAFAPFHQYKD